MKFDWTMSIGNVVTAIMGLISLVVIWVRLGDRVDFVEKGQARQTAALDEMARIGLLTTVNQHERRLTAVEASVQDIHEMKADIRWIKEYFSRLNDERKQNKNI